MDDHVQHILHKRIFRIPFHRPCTRFFSGIFSFSGANVVKRRACSHIHRLGYDLVMNVDCSAANFEFTLERHRLNV